MGARSESRAVAAIRKIEAAGVKGSVEWLPLDLQDLAAVKSAAKSFAAKEKHLDILFLNAGIMATPYQLSKDGIEGQIQTNHVSHFFLANLLLNKLEASSDPRVVSTSSTGHQFFKAQQSSFTSLDALNGDHGSTWTRYGQSKLANILFANGLAERHPKILANSCHPGAINTELLRGPGASYGQWAQTIGDAISHLFSEYLGITLTPPQGALTQLYLGTSDEVRKQEITGKYYQPIALPSTHSASVTKENADKLWSTTEQILSDKGYTLSL